MPTIHFLLPDGSTRTVQAPNGHSLMQAAVLNNVPGIEGECGGSCACATCHVYVDESVRHRLAPPDDMESGLLEGLAAPREAGSRLGCQIALSADLEGCTVRVPAAQS